MSRSADPNNKQKRIDTDDFYGYLETLKQPRRGKTIWQIAGQCGVDRSVVYSWCYMCSGIPDFAKIIIEEIIGKKIFSIRPYNE